MQLVQLRELLSEQLFEKVIPFWTNHAIDSEGGINTCIAEDGTLILRDKWLWSQWRAVWVFSKLYNCFERRDDWLTIAKQIADFGLRHGWDEQVGGWRLCLSQDGRQLSGCDSLYVDAFAIYGLTELFRATGDQRYRDWACKTADRALCRLRVPHDQIPHFPYPVPPGARVHGLPMIFSLVMWELGQTIDEASYREVALAMTEDVFQNFYRFDRDLLLERVANDNREYPPPFGTTVVPGHVIECMWFQIHIARDCGNQAAISECCRLIRRHLELGWDNDYGGIRHAIDADGRTEAGWPFPDAKLWWPHVEALYACLLAFEHTQDENFLDWYQKVHDYSFAHFPTSYGEWTQKLDRFGHPFEGTPSLPVKDPFHLPRALIYCLEVLDRLVGCEQLSRQIQKPSPTQRPFTCNAS